MFNTLNLDERILSAIEKCGYTTPTPVQAKAIPAILNGSDVVASAQTGTGKTAAFVLPALQHLTTQKPNKATRILILTPTRELAAQITKAADMYGKFLKFNIVSLVGGMPYHHQIRDLQRGADIIVATPGRLMDHMQAQRVDLSHVDMLILDEADRMLDMGFIDDVQYIAKLTPQKRQTLLFSATVDKQLTSIVRNLLTDPVRIDLSSEKLAAPKIKQELYRATSPQHKNRLLKHFLSDANIFKAIIFSATKINADRIAEQLRDDGFKAAALHGDLRQNVRNRTIEELRRGKIQFLVATDVAARGIDISDITHVINYDLPKFSEDYVHRIGRTGRAGKEGTAISFMMPSDTRTVQKIERYLGQRIPMIHHFDLDKFAPKAQNDSDVNDDHDDRDDKPARRSFREDGDRPRKFANEEGYRSRTSGGRDGAAPRSRDSNSRDGGFRGGESRGSRDSSSREGGFRGGESRGSRDSSSREGGFRGGESRGSRDSSPREGGFRGGESRGSRDSSSREGGFRGGESRGSRDSSSREGGFRGGESRGSRDSSSREGGFRGGESRGSRDSSPREGGFRGRSDDSRRSGSEGGERRSFSSDRRSSSSNTEGRTSFRSESRPEGTGARRSRSIEGGESRPRFSDSAEQNTNSKISYKEKRKPAAPVAKKSFRSKAANDGFDKAGSKDGNRPFKKRSANVNRYAGAKS